MEQNNILTKEQVKFIFQSVSNSNKLEAEKLFEKAAETLNAKVNQWAIDNRKLLEDCAKLKINSVKAENKRIEAINKLVGENHNFFISNIPTMEEEIESIIINYKNLLTIREQLDYSSRYRFIIAMENITKGIICTLTNSAYENIVKSINDKLKLNDLFENRKQYITI